jgi:hypothetical protein
MPIQLNWKITLLVLAALFFLLVFNSSNLLGQPGRDCNDPIPESCEIVRSLGEMADCACFICNPNTNRERTVCTRNQNDKDTLRRRIPR